MNYSSVDEVKSYLNVKTDSELANKLAGMGFLRVGTRQTIYHWNGIVPKNISDALELQNLKETQLAV